MRALIDINPVKLSGSYVTLGGMGWGGERDDRITNDPDEIKIFCGLVIEPTRVLSEVPVDPGMPPQKISRVNIAV